MKYLEQNQIAEELMTKWSELEPERCCKIESESYPGHYFYYVNYFVPEKGERHWDFDFENQYRNEFYQYALLEWCIYEAICDHNWKACFTISSEGTQVTVAATFSTNACSHSNSAIALLQAYLKSLEFDAKIHKGE